MRFAVFITSGIGNALLLIPLIQRLRASGTVTCFAASPFASEAIFQGFEDDLFERVVDISSKASIAKAALVYRNGFDTAFLDYFSSGRKHLLLAHGIAQRIVTNRIPQRLPAPFRQKVRFVPPVAGIHEGTQYLRFLDPGAEDADLHEEHFRLTPRPPVWKTERPYITLQPGSGNNATPWKTWPLDRWQELVQWLTAHDPGLRIVVLGDQTEVWMNEPLQKTGAKVTSLIGKTKLSELPGIIGAAEMHLGGDSGLLHIAGCTGTPTVSVWGGSDPQHFGWHKVNPGKHVTISSEGLPCHPCNRWIEPNQSRVSDPAACPDFKCIRKIDVDRVKKAIVQQLAPGGA